jgi:hypothetical protein
LYNLGNYRGKNEPDHVDEGKDEAADEDGHLQVLFCPQVT